MTPTLTHCDEGQGQINFNLMTNQSLYRAKINSGLNTGAFILSFNKFGGP